MTRVLASDLVGLILAGLLMAVLMLAMLRGQDAGPQCDTWAQQPTGVEWVCVVGEA